jgi:dihydrofolate reductase
VTDKQTFVTSIEAGIETARAAAGDRDVAIMGGGVVTAALRAGLLDEVILHQVPVLLGDGRRFFQELPAHIGLSLVEAMPAPGVTHLRYRIEK